MDCRVKPVKPGNDEGSYIASAEPRDLLRPVYRDVEVGHQTVGERIDPAVHAEILAAGPGLLHEHVVGDVPHLADQIGRASCRERVGVSGVGGSLETKETAEERNGRESTQERM